MRIRDWSSDVCSSDLPLQTEILGRSVTSHTLRIEDCLVRPKGSIVRVLHVEQLALELRGIMSAKRTGNGDAGALGEHGIAIDDDLVEPLLAIADMVPVPIAIAEVGVIIDLHLIAGPEIGRASWRERVCQYV